MKPRFASCLAFVLAVFVVVSPAVAQETCVVNLTSFDVRVSQEEWVKEEGCGGVNSFTVRTDPEKTINRNGDNAFCTRYKGDRDADCNLPETNITVSVNNTLTGVSPRSDRSDFQGASLGGDLYLSTAVEGADGVYRYFVRRQDPTVTDGCAGRSECVLAVAGSWGTSADCPQSSFGFGACGSGENADCGGHPVKLVCHVLNTPPGSGEVEVSGGFGERVTCPAGKAVTKLCGSGRDLNCDGRSHVIKCEDVGSGITLSSPHWMGQGQWGDNIVRCADDEVMTGYCGSGMNADCYGDPAQIQCSKMSSL